MDIKTMVDRQIAKKNVSYGQRLRQIDDEINRIEKRIWEKYESRIAFLSIFCIQFIPDGYGELRSRWIKNWAHSLYLDLIRQVRDEQEKLCKDLWIEREQIVENIMS